MDLIDRECDMAARSQKAGDRAIATTVEDGEGVLRGVVSRRPAGLSEFRDAIVQRAVPDAVEVARTEPIAAGAGPRARAWLGVSRVVSMVYREYAAPARSILLLAGLIFAVGAVPASAVINGDVVTDPNQYPWFVTLKIGDGRTCGGTLVDKKWVLTAQHCVRVAKGCEAGKLIHAKGRHARPWRLESKIRVIARATTIEGLTTPNTTAPGALTTTVTQIKVPSKSEHPYNYVANGPSDGDIALLKLKKSFKNIQPVILDSASHLARPDLGTFAAGRILGHGSFTLPTVSGTCDSPGTEEPPSSELRQGYLIAKDSTAGLTSWESLPFPDEYPQNGMGSGDSGGPVLVRNPSDGWSQVGVISASNDTLPMIGLSARVDYFWQFINRVLHKRLLPPTSPPG